MKEFYSYPREDCTDCPDFIDNGAKIRLKNFAKHIAPIAPTALKWIFHTKKSKNGENKMATLEEVFTRYGYPADEMNEKIWFYFRRADKIETFDRVQQADKDAQDKITSLCIWIELLKEYRKTLYARAQELCAADYSMKLTLRRRVDSWHNKRYYDITVAKIINAPNARPIVILSEEYKGTERHTALKRFEELKKQYPNIETEKDIEKMKWER